jgi:hypothetical protein
MSTGRAIDPRRDDADDYVVVDARQVILDLPDGATATDLLPGRTLGSGGGHAAWLRGPRQPSADGTRESHK